MQRYSIRILLAAVVFFGVTAGKVYADPDSSDETRQLDTPVGAFRYTPARGLSIGDSGLVLGGYSSLVFERFEGEPAELIWEDLSALVSWHWRDRFSLFSEIEVEDLLRATEDGNGGAADADLQVERLHADASLGDRLNLRVGKFLTPVGLWNVVHAPPLVWTTSRPVATTAAFDQHVTGAMVYGAIFPGRARLAYSLYGQATDAFEPVHQEVRADRAAGVRFALDLPIEPELGASYLAFRGNRDGQWRQLGGIDVAWESEPIELFGEAVVSGGPNVRETWGGYLQSAVRLVDELHFVVRYEYFDTNVTQALHLVPLGLAFRPLPYCVLKAEYRIANHADNLAPPGFLSSVAVLF